MSEANESTLEEKLAEIISGPDRADKNYGAGKALVSLLPAGGPIAEFYSTYITPPATKRLHRFLEHLVRDISHLKDEIKCFDESIFQRDSFVTTLLNVLQIAVRSHQEDKLKMLRNVVLNSVLPNAPDEDLQLMFLNLIDIFTVRHLRLMLFADNPKDWFEKHYKDNDEALDSILRDSYKYEEYQRDLIEVVFPELSSRLDFYEQVFRDLRDRGLIKLSSRARATQQARTDAIIRGLEQSTSNRDKMLTRVLQQLSKDTKTVGVKDFLKETMIRESSTSDLGKLFVRFLEDPKV